VNATVPGSNRLKAFGKFTFDLLIAGGVLPLKQRKAALARIGERANRWIALTTASLAKGGLFTGPAVDADRRASSPRRLTIPKGLFVSTEVVPCRYKLTVNL
jgi:hypothetical protein